MALTPFSQQFPGIQAAEVLQAFEAAHSQELTAITELLVRITHRPPEQIKPLLETILEQLVEPQWRRFDPQQWEEDIKFLSKNAEKIPVLPTEAFTRESIYRDHD